MAGMVVAQEGFITEHAGQELQVQVGDIFRDDHPIVKRTPTGYWKPVAARFDGVEQATAAPGEKRNVRVKRDAAGQ